MSIYLSSDLHGDFTGFKKLLEKIAFDKNADKIYILGDIIDRGKESITLLHFVMKLCQSGCASVIKGNHELFLERYLNGFLSSKQWSAWGGANTIKELSSLSKEQKYELLDFVSALPHFCELKIGNRDYVLTHAGLHSDFLVEKDDKIDVIASLNKTLDYDEFEFLISTDIHYMNKKNLKKLDKYLFVGHTPTFMLDINRQNCIVKNEYYTDLDSGSGYRGGKVSALRLDDMKEFYIKIAF